MSLTTSSPVAVDPDALAGGARDLRLAAARVNTARDDLQRAAIGPVLALPGDSDLYRAYVFAWGRWSAVLDLAYGSATVLAHALEVAATVYEDTERAVIGTRSAR